MRVSNPSAGDTGADIGPLGRSFAAEVRRRREQRGLSQTDLAALLRDRYSLKFHQATIDRVEKAVRPCRLDEVYAIAEALGCSVDDMLDDWSTAEKAWRQLAGVALRAREAETRIAMAVQQNLESLQGDRMRVQAGLERLTADGGASDVEQWAREVLVDLDRIWTWAADFSRTQATSPAVPPWVSEVLDAAHPATTQSPAEKK